MDVLSFYHCIYGASENYAANLAWTGSVANCLPGTTGESFKEDVRRRINFYRALVSMPSDIRFDPVWSSKAQEAALMFSANNARSHYPPATWACYTQNAAEAAENSNITIARYGPAAVDTYIRDDGSMNQPVGHRRLLFNSYAAVMGTGDVPVNGDRRAANAIWVSDFSRPAPAPQFVAWPNRGYVPFNLMPARWSLSYGDADFAAAEVAMKVAGKSVAATIVSKTDNGYGENTLVWQPAGLPASLTEDVNCDVTVTGIRVGGVGTTYSYTVTLFNPLVLGAEATISGSTTPPTTGASYTFEPVPGADGYELRVSSGSAALITEGGEDSASPQIVQSTTGSYSLRQTAVKRTGSKAFQLALPSFDDQSFELTREFIPSATSQLLFYDRGRFATATTTLSAEVSTDNGGTWASLFSRPGVGLSNSLWDEGFRSRSVSLAPYRGKQVRVRFILRSNGGSIAQGSSPDYGFFIDDISVTNATELVDTTVTSLASGSNSFSLNATTAGRPLVAGSQYYLRVRPNVGCRWFGDGPTHTVLAQVPTGYPAWVATQYPGITGDAGDDHEQDGMANIVEYAFGLNPTAANAASALPQPVRTADALSLSYTPPAGITGVTYGAQWSADLQQWFDIADSGSGGTHTFSVSTAGHSGLFIRHHIAVSP